MNFGILIFILVVLIIALQIYGGVLAHKVNEHYLVRFKNGMTQEQQEALLFEICNKFASNGYKQVHPERGADFSFQKGLIRKWPVMGIFIDRQGIEIFATSWKYRKQLFVEFPINPGIFRTDNFCRGILEEYITEGYTTDTEQGLKNAR